jgi:hypothetical protein
MAGEPASFFPLKGESLEDLEAMYAFKLRLCSDLHPHDWTLCPYAHEGEVARRRNPAYHSVSCKAPRAASSTGSQLADFCVLTRRTRAPSMSALGLAAVVCAARLRMASGSVVSILSGIARCCAPRATSARDLSASSRTARQRSPSPPSPPIALPKNRARSERYGSHATLSWRPDRAAARVGPSAGVVV